MAGGAEQSQEDVACLITPPESGRQLLVAAPHGEIAQGVYAQLLWRRRQGYQVSWAVVGPGPLGFGTRPWEPRCQPRLRPTSAIRSATAGDDLGSHHGRPLSVRHGNERSTASEFAECPSRVRHQVVPTDPAFTRARGRPGEATLDPRAAASRPWHSGRHSGRLPGGRRFFLQPSNVGPSYRAKPRLARVALWRYGDVAGIW